MNTETIIAELRLYNRWRRGDEAITAPDPTALGKLLDAAADSLASLIASNTTLRRERNEAREQAAAEHAKAKAEFANLVGEIKRLEHENDGLLTRITDMDHTSEIWELDGKPILQTWPLKVETVREGHVIKLVVTQPYRTFPPNTMSTTKKRNGTTRKRRSSLVAGSVAAKRLIQRIAYRMWTNEPDRADGRYTVRCVLEMAGVIRRQNTKFRDAGGQSPASRTDDKPHSL